MEPKVCEGKLIELELNGKVFLALDMPREPEKARANLDNR